ncbi:carboxypeptidase C (cathepsin A) [Nitrospirillum amazonense]|uniref:Carboxypeptidase C (Cathepsin A) n=1 Tax=Nitrospirillum amazonense TaxID=28077 RepID=A0A560EXR3_9PROT|nr:peptidase S10 [Nitrospirillum amazonense]TWB14168.1 carboxypeptidase C (cathepsin A) [Nitrospirillum amazonense]
MKKMAGANRTAKWVAAALAAVLMTGVATHGWAEDKKDKGGEDGPKAGKIAEQIEAATARAPIVETAKSSAHSVTIRGKSIRYQATAGTLTIRDDNGKPTASVFYVAYTAEGAPATKRPVTFLYNGGPGSASLWMHMGLGPVRVRTSAPDNTPPAPYVYSANEDSILDKTDLVFIDAVGTGYSRPLGDAKDKDFWGVDQDVDAFARAINRYVTINNRWNSPKFLFGESYGTTRSSALANRLQQDGMDLNGVVLLSSILNYGIRQPGFDNIFVSYLPSYAATAWYHNRIANKPADLPAFLQKVRDYARGPYTVALAKGQDITPEEEDAVAKQLSAYTGLSVPFLKQAKLRVSLQRFRKELLRDEAKTVGRLDSRFVGVDIDSAGEGPEYDASSNAVTSAFISSQRAYISGDLGYKTDLDYRRSADGAIGQWDWHHKIENRRMEMPDVALDLAQAMRQNPHLQLLSLNGWYDMATPFFGTEYDIGHMQLEPAQRRNVTFKYYPSGHMVYLNPDALKQMVADLDAFYDKAAPAAP